jgi:hypothetical protein
MSKPAPDDLLPRLEEIILDVDLRELWYEFLDGGWVPGPPEDPGVYPVASAEGDYIGLKEFILRKGKVVDKLQGHNEPDWQGYSWSRPLPPPPAGVE